MTRDGTDMAAREVYPETMRPHVPSPGRTGTGGSVTPPFGVLCGGETTYVWSFLSGGVLWSIACDGWVTTHYAFHPFTATDGAPVASDGSGPLRRGEPWEASWPEGQWENVRAVDACESSSGMHPDTYRTDLIHGGRMQIARGVWAEFFEREYGWPWEQVVTDDETNFAAAYVIYERAGGWGPWPFCGRGMR